MKNKYILTSLMVLILATSVIAQNWKQVTAASLSTSISDSYFFDANVGWIVGAKGFIRKTTDGGKNWISINSTITEDLKTIYFLNSNTGFIGSATKIYKSTDGFATYTSVNVTGVLTSPTYYGIYFSDEQKGWFLSATSSASKILQTTDGGTTWTVGLSLTSGVLQCIDFYSATAGIAAGTAGLYYTKNGTTWTKGNYTYSGGVVYSRGDLRGIRMLSADVAVAGGWGTTALGLQPTILLRTTDGGVNWTYQAQSTSNLTYEYVYDFCFTDVNNGFAAGGATKSSNFLKTTDGGVNWTPMNIPGAVQIVRLFVFGNNIIAVSSNAIFKSPDLGTTWQLITPIPAITLSTLFAVNDNVIYAGGQKGLILKTTDGGNNWKASFQIVNNVGANINGLYFVDQNIGYSANSYSMIAKTTDGGKTWNAVKNDSIAATSSNSGITFTSSNDGFIVGQAASNVDVIYKTANGGASLTTTKSIVLASLRAVAFYNTQVGAAVGDKMKAVYTKNGGTTWAASTISGVPAASATNNLSGIAFFNANDAIAVGNKVTLKTTDGGVTWNYINTTIDQSLAEVVFSNNGTWALGTKSNSPKSIGILQSADNGQSWINKVDYSVFDTTSVNYNDIAVALSGAVFVCGASGSIYTNSPTVVGVKENGNELPAVFELKQNYPNPFNPTTKINYTLNKPGFVKLNIYDVLGRVVKTLVNESQNPGNHEIEFNASSLASGAYIYSISVNNSIISKKMILVK